MTKDEIAQLAEAVAGIFEKRPKRLTVIGGFSPYRYWECLRAGNPAWFPRFRLDDSYPDGDSVIVGRMLDKMEAAGYSPKIFRSRQFSGGPNFYLCDIGGKPTSSQAPSRVLAVAKAFEAVFRGPDKTALMNDCLVLGASVRIEFDCQPPVESSDGIVRGWDGANILVEISDGTIYPARSHEIVEVRE